MPVYQYSAEDLVEQVRHGTLTADTPADGRQQLRERGLRILEFRPAVLTRPAWTPWLRFHGHRKDQVSETARFLALLLGSGVPLTESLEVLTRRQRGRWVDTLKDLRERISRGASLAEALHAHPRHFDELFVSAVRVGELSGNLEEALTELAEQLEVRTKLRGQLRGALTYPAILIVLGIGVVVFLMSFVAPQLLAVLQASGRPLPLSTRILKSFSDLLVHQWLALLLGIAVITTALAVSARLPRGRKFWQELQLRIPLLGPLIQKNIVAQFAYPMTLLLKTGVPFVEALRTVRRLTHHAILEDELERMERAVESGSDIAPTLHDSRIFPPVVVHLVGVGQETGRLAEMLHQLRVAYQTEVRLALTRFTTILEPLLIVLLGGAVGFVVYACLMPILEATRGIQ